MPHDRQEDPRDGRLRDLVALHEASAALHAAHAARLGALAERDHARLVALHRSLSWRVTWPLRAAGLALRALIHPVRAGRAVIRRLRGHRLRARLRRVLREEGLRVTVFKVLRLSRNLSLHAVRFVAVRLGQSDDRLRAWANVARHRRAVVATRLQHWLGLVGVARDPVRRRLAAPQGLARVTAADGSVTASGAAAVPPARLFAPRVLIVGELSLPQCAKYRVWQKQENLISLGVACEVADWTDLDAARAALQLCAMVIFYRVPGHPQVLALFDEARRLGLEVIWEVDDLIFDAALYLADRDLGRLDPEIRRGVLAGAALYERAWRAADRGIASTPALAGLMRACGPARVAAEEPVQVDVIDNALDADTISAADALLGLPRDADDGVCIVYGSGSRTHDGDFAIAAPALATILARHPRTRLRIVGELAIPDALRVFGERVEHLPALRYRDYLALLARADINLAPLEDTPFNSAKSNIKFVEAGILAIPSVCSPTANFAAAIEDGVNGWLPRDTQGWTDALERLVSDAGHRATMGRAARVRVLDRYAPARIAATQLAPLVAPLRQARGADIAAGRLRVLAVHHGLYPPRADGRLALARQAIEQLAMRPDVALSLFTTEDLPDAPPYALRRLTDRTLPVIAMRPPRRRDPVLSRDDPSAARRFAEVLDAIRPDVVWLHGLRGLGAGLARLCTERDIPYALDLADPWWRVDAAGTVGDGGVEALDVRLERAVIGGALRHAARLIAPGAAVAEAAIAAGAPAARVEILPPGIDPPAPMAGLRPDDGALRFGYAGTEEGDLVLRAFSHWLARHPGDDVSLCLVDHARAEGYAALLPRSRAVARRCRIVAPFDAAGRDAFFDGIDVLLYPGNDPLAGAQIACEALARGIPVAAAHGVRLPRPELVTRFAATSSAEILAETLRGSLAGVSPARAEVLEFPTPAMQAARLRAILDRCLPPSQA